jgi:hypothetical protein
METGMKRILAVSVMLLLAGCKGVGLGSLDTEEGAMFPGIDSLDTASEAQKKEKEWADKFYGRDTDGGCDFYGNCKEGAKQGWW